MYSYYNIQTSKRLGPLWVWVHSFIQIRNVSRNIYFPKMYAHQIIEKPHDPILRCTDIWSTISNPSETLGKQKKICLGELNPCSRISTFGLVHSNTCLWSKETLFMRAKCIKEEHAVAPAPYLIWDSCYCSRKLSPMEGYFLKWFLSVKKVLKTWIWFDAAILPLLTTLGPQVITCSIVGGQSFTTGWKSMVPKCWFFAKHIETHWDHLVTFGSAVWSAMQCNGHLYFIHFDFIW